MKIAAWIARILLGVIFVGLASMYWFVQPPPMEEGNAKQFFQVVASTHFMDVVKVCEVVGGLLVLSGRFTPLGLAILIPITFNILLFTTLVAPQWNPLCLLSHDNTPGDHARRCKAISCVAKIPLLLR